ncbi:MAG: hypothetical protein A3F09_03055 [Chlamydiae bacterium RIFCSPHIGHO2_12_FULL_49_11]|nr:MAG: hypothetical protein A3F09_03055 [Chlamydiae bacterium RIFCSPHIGHO2_12_FULL_49_11]
MITLVWQHVSQGALRGVLQVMGASLLLAVFAQISLPLIPVPVTGQTFGVMLIAALLGKEKALLATLLYMAEAAAGLPVLAHQSGGIHALTGVTGGYIFGFSVQAYLIGLSFERRLPAPFLWGSLVQLILGTAWLAVFIGFEKALFVGCLPFIPGELMKIALATTWIKKYANSSLQR